MSTYLHHDGLFHAPYFARVVADEKVPTARELPTDADTRILRLVSLWEAVRDRLVRHEAKAPTHPFVGLPPNLRPITSTSESVVEHDFVRPVLEQVLGFSTETNRTLTLEGVAEPSRRPDTIVFATAKRHKDAVTRADKISKGSAPNAADFCREADFVLDAKKFAKGIGSDAETANEAQPAKDQSAAADLQQLADYLTGCGKVWGVLTNGRSWRLMRQGGLLKHLRFDLVAWLEDLRARDRTINADDRKTFGLFWHLFGPPAVGGGWLDRVYRHANEETRRVQEILRENAHEAVLLIAAGFLEHPENELSAKPSQEELDHLRELALIFLYRLLFVLKAEAQNLLPMRDDFGRTTLYAKHIATAVVFRGIQAVSEGDRAELSAGFDELNRIFTLVDRGGAYDVPPYNGGLFDPERHAELARLKLRDNVCFELLNKLIYLDAGGQPVPYADLDVRDLGSIYEGLLEQRLVSDKRDGKPVLALRGQKGERKASGSYFTPDALVDHVVRSTLTPLFAECHDDPRKILDLKIVDPAMGSGHFLVKVVDVMAWHLTLRCAPIDKGIPNDNGPDEYAYWKRKVVERCIYGVDVNPMAVELAKVALWLHTAARGKPLSFLDHHLKCGNSLVGATLDGVATPGRRSKKKRDGKAVWESIPHEIEVVVDTSADGPAAVAAAKKANGNGQMSLNLPYDTKLFTSVLQSIHAMLARSSDRPDDVKQKSRDYREVERRLRAHRLLCDLWCAQWFLVEANRAGIYCYESSNGLYDRLKGVCDIRDDKARATALAQIVDGGSEPIVKAIEKAGDEGYGPRLLRFFHWQLEFPEVAFDENGHLRTTFGFDAVVGNPPWDKIKPAKRDFYGPFDAEIPNTQGPSLDGMITKLEARQPRLEKLWEHYEHGIEAFVCFLSDSAAYRRQVAQLDGRRTGGDPDLFRYFLERAIHCVRHDGMVGQVVPCTLWQGEGCTGLRQMVFNECEVDSLYTFENYRKWAFGIHSSFKFTTLVMRRAVPKTDRSFPAAFMLRDTRVLEGSAPKRLVRLSKTLISSLSPGTLSLVDLRTEKEATLVGRLHQTFRAFGSAASGWSAAYARELDMTNDAWMFKTRDWMALRGFTCVMPERKPDGSWVQQRTRGPGSVAKVPVKLPDGGEFWVAANASYYRERSYVERRGDLNGKTVSWFVHDEDIAKAAKPRARVTEEQFRIRPGELYTALYEGRMVHNLDHAQKGYVSGEGRKAVWSDLPVAAKLLGPRAFVSVDETGQCPRVRVGFCDVTGATNERTTLAALIPSSTVCGNTVPTFTLETRDDLTCLTAVMSSFVWDALARLRVSTHLNYVYLRQIPIPSRSAFTPHEFRVRELVARLSCTTPELAEVWDAAFPKSPWSYASAERDLWKRALMRAELDAIVADLYGLSVEEYAYVLTTFPLLDRDQPALPGDAYVTDGDGTSKRGPEGERWEERSWGIVEREPRSFITRDLALLTHARRKKYPIPERIDAWYRDAVGFDPEGELSRFRVGAVKDLAERVERAREMGAVAYVPSSRGGDDGDGGDDGE